MTELLLIRHGETAWNHDRRIQGQLDVPLNAIGVLQAEAVAARLARRRIDALYTSDLGRASQTADAIARACGLSARVDARLRERHFGRLEGTLYAEMPERDPDAHARLGARDLAFDADSGETLPAVAARVHAALDAIVARHPGGVVVVVSHGGALDCAYRLATGEPLEAPRRCPLLNASINTLRHDGAWRLVAWGDVDHLADSRDEIDPRARPAAPVGGPLTAR